MRPLGEEDPGLLAALADYQGHKCGGVLVPLLRSAPTVGAVLSQLIRYNPIHASPVIWQVRADGDHVFMSVWLEAEVAPVDPEVRELLVTLALMQVTSGLASITGGASSPSQSTSAPQAVISIGPRPFSPFLSLPIVQNQDFGLIEMYSGDPTKAMKSPTWCHSGMPMWHWKILEPMTVRLRSKVKSRVGFAPPCPPGVTS